MNLYHFSGNLGADPVLRHTPQGKAVVQFNVGVSSGYGESRKTVWVRCQAWEKSAELIADAFVKGAKFNGCGEIVSDRWSKDGKENPQIEVRIMNFDFPPKNTSTGSASHETARPNEQNAGGFDEMDQDIPF